MFKNIYNFFDKLEDKVRGKLSHFPIIYAFLGGIGVVFFWRGIWHTIDYLMFYASVRSQNLSSTDLIGNVWWDGPLSFAIGSCLLLMTGVFISNFIGNEIIISGLKGEKKIVEKTEQEIRTEKSELQEVKDDLIRLAEKLNQIQK